MRIAIVAESFLPAMHGVTRSVLRVLEELRLRGHELVVIAPGDGPGLHGDTPVERVPAVTLPVYRALTVGLPTGRVESLLRNFDPDVAYIANPVVLGAAGLRAARRLGIPTLAVHQTDLAAFAGHYHLGVASPMIWRWLRRTYRLADLVLAPSTAAMWDLRRHGVYRVGRWPRGVDLEAFDPANRDDALRHAWAPGGEVVVGYIGRLAAEKRIHLLAPVTTRPGVRVVVVGDGPAREDLQAELPGAHFTGHLDGPRLAAAHASLDVFVHTGAAETFCQAVQEALASGVPVVAPAAGGPLDLVQHGVNGYLFPADDPYALEDAVVDLTSDAERRLRMGENGRQSVLHRSWTSVCDELERHLAVLASASGARRAPLGAGTAA